MGKSLLTACNQETADVVYLHAQNCSRRALYWNCIPGRALPWRQGGFNFSFCSLSVAPSPCPTQYETVSNSPVSNIHEGERSTSNTWGPRSHGGEGMEREGTDASFWLKMCAPSLPHHMSHHTRVQNSIQNKACLHQPTHLHNLFTYRVMLTPVCH